MVHNCPSCKSKVEADFKFCGVCGKLLKKTCQRCNIKFEPTFNFCGQCGTALEKSSFDPNSGSQKKEHAFTDKSGIKVKVSILLGLDLNTIKQEQGGGPRRVYLNQTDDFNRVKKKITELYFPRNSYTCLGRISEYRINMLDFKKQLLNYHNFKNVSSYVDTHGLTLQVKPIFFLHLFRNENYLNTGSVVPVANAEKNPKVDRPLTKAIKEKEDSNETSDQCSKVAMKCSKKLGNEKKLVESSSSSSSESETEDDKNNLSTQNVGHQSLRQINKFLNPSENNLAKRRIHKRDSSSSSVSSSSSTASFKKAKKLDKKLNRRIQDLKKEADPDHLKKRQNTEALLPTPNKTPSSKANKLDQFKNNHNSASNKNLVILLKEKTSHECEEIVIDDGNQKNYVNYKSEKNYTSYSHNHYYSGRYHSYSSNNNNYNYSSNYNQSRYSNRNNSGYRRYNNNHNYYYKNDKNSISGYGNYDYYKEDKSNAYS